MALARRAVQLPFTAISIGLEAWERSRGMREFALRRADEALQIAAATPLGRLLPKQFHDDSADQEAARIAVEAAQARADEARRAAVEQVPAALKKSAPSAAAKQVGAPGAVAEQVDRVQEQLHIETPQSSDALPIPDFDNTSIGSLRARLRALSIENLVTLREWEQSHANRLQVLTTLDNRIAKLAKESTDVGPRDTDYPSEAKAAERQAEAQGGTLRV